MKRVRERWARFTVREQWLLSGMGVLILATVVFGFVWQPMVQRVVASERQYQQQSGLAAQLQKARPLGVAAIVSEQPLSLRVSESVAAVGLSIQQMDTEGDGLRVTLSGEAQALLLWLDGLERQGEGLQSLNLEARDGVLWARVVLR